MKIKNIYGFTCLVIFYLFSAQAWAENILNSDSDFSIKIAVTINENDNLMGKLEYSNHAPQYPLQLVAFYVSKHNIFPEPYLLELLEKKIVLKNIHKIKCRTINGKYGNEEVAGMIDFSDELKPKINLVYENGNTYISNISEKGKITHNKYMPNVRLGQ